MIAIGFMAIVNLIKQTYHRKNQHHDFSTSHSCGNFHYIVFSILRPSDEYCQPLAPTEIAITSFFPSLIPLMSKVSEEIVTTFFTVTKGQRFGEIHYTDYEGPMTGKSLTNLSFDALYN